MKEEGYQPRTYRHWIESRDLAAFSVSIKETDLYIRAMENLQRKAYRITRKYRTQLEEYIAGHHAFSTSLEPLPLPPHAPRIVASMIEAGNKAGVGPMAAVAGAIAEEVGKELMAFSAEVMVENGGDIFLATGKERTIGLYAGESPLTGKLGLWVKPDDTPLGICTSSGTVGHSLSYGRADAVVVLSKSTPLADAAATAICNRVKSVEDIQSALDFGREIDGVTGIVIILGPEIGAWGDVTLRET